MGCGKRFWLSGVNNTPVAAKQPTMSRSTSPEMPLFHSPTQRSLSQLPGTTPKAPIGRDHALVAPLSALVRWNVLVGTSGKICCAVAVAATSSIASATLLEGSWERMCAGPGVEVRW